MYAFTRALDGEVLLVVCNLSRTPYRLADLLPQALDARSCWATCPTRTPSCCARGRPASSASADPPAGHRALPSRCRSTRGSMSDMASST